MNRLSVGELMTFVIYERMCNENVNTICNVYNQINESVHPMYELIGWLYDASDDIATITTTKKNADTEMEEINTVRVQNVSFTYDDKVLALNDVSFRIRKGQMYGIAGASGSGKSTMLKLLTGKYTNYEGGIVINEVSELRSVRMSEYYKRIGVVNQDVVLFDMSVYDNLRIGLVDDDVRSEDIVEVCKQMNAHDFISRLEMGYETKYGSEGGTDLSGGQKQRLSLVRAILRNPDMLLLDEATSALDTENEDHVLRSLTKLKNDKIILFVTHSKCILDASDKVIQIGTSNKKQAYTFGSKMD
jgi:ABC-type multidrug transport system fused ATPase/permease subunit